jgi:hypothetical protein
VRGKDGDAEFAGREGGDEPAGEVLGYAFCAEGY